MTVFDLIRFPNIDIFNNNDLRLLPRSLLEAWVGKCLEGVDYTQDLNLSDPRNNFGIIMFNIVVLKSRENSFGIGTTEQALNRIYTRCFTDLLRKMLGKYDT
jgi:hypothetical protein